MKTIVALYDDMAEARSAVESLVDAGIDRAKISLVAADASGEYAAYLEKREESIAEETDTVGEAALEGAVAGGVVGGLAGVLLGLAAIAIPGLGPVIAVGPLVAGLTGAGVGAVSGGLLAGLMEAGLSEEEAGYYVEGVRRGGTLVTAEVENSRVEEATTVMNRHNAIDIEKRAASWREEGWTGYDASAETYTSEVPSFERYHDTFKHHYTTRYADSDYTFSDCEPAYRYGYTLATNDTYRNKNWHEIEPEARERWEQEHDDSSWDDLKDAVQRGWREVKRFFDTDHEKSYASYEPRFRNHYDTNYAATDYPYEQYEPAYRYGYTLATEPRYWDYEWHEIESEARHRWQTEHDGPWDDFKDAVRYGWEQLKDMFTSDDINSYEPTFRRHYESTYEATPHAYGWYKPAYDYGYRLAVNPVYHTRTWQEVAPEAQLHWEERHEEHLWDDVKDAVRHAWHEVKETFDDDHEYGDYETYEPTFRRHYEANYASHELPYDRYQAAYRYGYTLATTEHLRDRNWAELEPELRREWEARHDSLWDDMKDAVRHAWHEVKEHTTGTAQRSGSENYDAHEPAFRRHYEATYASEGRSYDYYEPAYRYGHTLATEEAYANREWADIEPEVREEWNRKHDGGWDSFKEAIRHAYHEMRIRV